MKKFTAQPPLTSKRSLQGQFEVLIHLNSQSIAQYFMLIFDKFGICVGTQWHFVKKKCRNVCLK